MGRAMVALAILSAVGCGGSGKLSNGEIASELAQAMCTRGQECGAPEATPLDGCEGKIVASLCQVYNCSLESKTDMAGLQPCLDAIAAYSCAAVTDPNGTLPVECQVSR